MVSEPCFVLLHGAWRSAATWDLINQRLRTRGGVVFNPTLTGLGTDADSLSDVIALDTHIHDVVRLGA